MKKPEHKTNTFIALHKRNDILENQSKAMT